MTTGTGWEALVNIRRYRDRFEAEDVARVVESHWQGRDLGLRRASAALIATLGPEARGVLESKAAEPRARTTLALGIVGDEPARAVGLVESVLRDEEGDGETRLAAVRVVELALGGIGEKRWKGDVWEGYSPRERERLDGQTTKNLLTLMRNLVLRTSRGAVDREATRTLAMLEDGDGAALRSVVGRLGEGSDPRDDLHHLIVASRLRGSRTAEVRKAIARGLLVVQRKLRARRARIDRNWPLRVAELAGHLVERDPKLNEALIADPEFGDPEHVVFVGTAGFDRRRAAERFLERAEGDEGFAWSPALITLLGELPEERAFPVLRQLWGPSDRNEAILPILARHPEAEDRARFVAGLATLPADRVGVALAALETLPAEDPEELVNLVRLLARLRDLPRSEALREKVAGRLRRLTGAELAGVEAKDWVEWLAGARPELAERVRNPDGVDLAAWAQRRERIGWEGGDPERGEAVFGKASCASCHSGGTGVGPDLRGVGGRFGRNDLLAAILQPSREVPERYRSTLVATQDGQVYQGVIIYEAADGIILQTGAASTVRIGADAIAEQRASDVSLMPAGLLDGLSDAEVADLFAYLKGLGRTDALPGAADPVK